MMSAFLIGLVGSVHCAGMCGPLMLSLTRHTGRQALFSFVLYHAGRLAVYAAVGVFLGLISSSIQVFALQKYFTILLGIVVLTIFTFPRIRNRFEGWYYQSAFYQRVKNTLTGYYTTRFRWLAAGVLNGALPCGLVYLAAAGAMISGGAAPGASYMLVFGLGTLPMLAALGTLRFYMPRVIKRFSNVTTTVALISGVLLIVRGLTVETPDINQLIAAQISNLIRVCGF